MKSDPVRSESLHGGAVLRLTLQAPPGNILDIPMIERLRAALDGGGRAAGLKAILITGAGENFSYGVSVQDHRAATAGAMLRAFHGIFRALAGLDRVVVSTVRGACLGGGMELACFAHRLFAHPRSTFGQSEIKLGLFAPVGSLILARRAGQAVADEACLTGRTYDGIEARDLGLADETADDPAAAAEDWIAREILPKSAAALARAVRAARLRYNAEFLHDLEIVERLYLDDLMRTEDAREGIEAFLAKRPPSWKDR